MPRLDPKELRRISSASRKELRRISSASRAEKVAATQTKKKQVKALSIAMKKVWMTFVSSALSGNHLFVIRNVTEAEIKAISERFGLHARRETTSEGAEYTIDLNSMRFESLPEAEASGGFEASFLLWIGSEYGEGFVLLIEDAARVAALSGRTSLRFVVRQINDAAESTRLADELDRSSFFETETSPPSPIGYNYFIGRECIALDGPDPATFGFLMELLGYGVATTHFEKSTAVKLSW